MNEIIKYSPPSINYKKEDDSIIVTIINKQPVEQTVYFGEEIEIEITDEIKKVEDGCISIEFKYNTSPSSYKKTPKEEFAGVYNSEKSVRLYPRQWEIPLYIGVRKAFKQQKFPIQWHDAGYCYRIYPNGQLSPFVTLKESKTTTTVWKLTLQEDRRFDFNIKILPYTKLKITFSEYKTQAS